MNTINVFLPQWRTYITSYLDQPYRACFCVKLIFKYCSLLSMSLSFSPLMLPYFYVDLTLKWKDLKMLCFRRLDIKKYLFECILLWHDYLNSNFKTRKQNWKNLILEGTLNEKGPFDRDFLQKLNIKGKGEQSKTFFLLFSCMQTIKPVWRLENLV